jgi:hypothetical protein
VRGCSGRRQQRHRRQPERLATCCGWRSIPLGPERRAFLARGEAGVQSNSTASCNQLTYNSTKREKARAGSDGGDESALPALEGKGDAMMLEHLCVRRACDVRAAHSTAQLHVPRRTTRRHDDRDIVVLAEGWMRCDNSVSVTHRGGARGEGR